jgi:hypothetical protein
MSQDMGAFCLNMMLDCVTVAWSSNVTKCNMTYITVKQAENLTGKSRQTLWRDAKKGKVSVKKDSDGNNIYDPAELERAYGTLQQRYSNEAVSMLPDATIENRAVLQQENRFLREKIAALESNLEKSELREKDLSAKLDKAQSTIEKQTYLISDMREKSPRKPVERHKSFLATLLRKND